MVEVVILDKFLQETMGGFPPRAKMHICEGVLYECGCGKTHKYSENQIEVIRELEDMKFVFVCHNDYVTLVKLKGDLSLRSNYKFISLLSARNFGPNEDQSKFDKMSDEEVMEILGHKDPRMTVRYQHLAPGHLRDAMGALDKTFERDSYQEKQASGEAHLGTI